jgi:hypothetical protein
LLPPRADFFVEDEAAVVSRSMARVMLVAEVAVDTGFLAFRFLFLSPAPVFFFADAFFFFFLASWPAACCTSPSDTFLISGGMS